jgi:alpha-L-fucosidase 2
MKRLLFIFLLCSFQFSQAQKSDPDFIWYNKPANVFEDALPLGNGRIGAMVYGGVDKERISLNEATLWAGYPVDPNMNPAAKNYLPLIRAALFAGDYKKADSLTRFIQGKFSSSYAPLGNLYIDFGIKDASNYKRRLDLNTGIHQVSFDADGTQYIRETFVSHPDQVIMMKLKSSGKNKMNVSLSFNSLLNHKVEAELGAFLLFKNRIQMKGIAPSVAEPNYRGNIKDAVQYDSTKSMRFVADAGIFKTDGKIKSVGDKLIVDDATEIILFVSLATSFNGFDKNPALQGKDELGISYQHLKNLTGKKYEDVKVKHVQDFSPYYNRVQLNLENRERRAIATDERLRQFAKGALDNDLASLYFQFGRYLMISASRTPEVPMNLQGIWNEQVRPPWSSNYTININTEMNYWAAETANLSEFHKPLFGFIKNLSKTGRVTANTFYGVDGWVAHHNSDIWAMSNPVGDFGKGDPVWANWTMGGTWLSTHLWDHFLFSRDTAFLRNTAYPILKDAAKFCLQFLVKDAEGKWVTAPSTSPENVFITDKGLKGAVLFGSTADLAMIRELFSNVIDAAAVLHQDEQFSKQVKLVLNEMHPYSIGKKGNLQEWYYDWEDEDPKHRHVSHLFGLYPGTSITMKKTPALADAVKQSLLYRTNNGTGWSIAWKINLWARLQNAESAYDALKTILAYYPADKNEVKMVGGGTYPNLFDAHPPFQIDGNFGATAGIIEMLVQSHDGEILLLPALPEQWRSGSIKGVKARGGYTVDIEWKEGKLSMVKIVPNKGGKTSVVYKDRTWEVNATKELVITL